MSDSAPKIIYKAFDPVDASQRRQIIDLINDSGMHASDSLPGIGEVALIEDLIVGYIGAHIKYTGAGHIDIFAVDYTYRRRGIGLELGQRILYRLYHRGCRTFSAVTETDAASAIALYRSLGIQFKIIYEFESGIGSIIDKLTTRLEDQSNEESIPVT